MHLTHYNPPLTGKLTENAKFIDPENFKKPSKRYIKKNENGSSLSDFKGGRNVTIYLVDILTTLVYPLLHIHYTTV